MTVNAVHPPLIYNLFPRYFDSIESWHSEIPRIADMGFNAIFINPVHESGLSGSMYAIKDYYKLDSRIAGKGADTTDWRTFRNFVAACDDQGVAVIVDLVINHTAIDSTLVTKCPKWFKHDRNGAIIHPGAVDFSSPEGSVVWGDLAEIDNKKSLDRERLWQYWDRLVAFFQGMGVAGFRCDAAYKVPAPLWIYLIERAHTRAPDVLFLAESLGCMPQEVKALKGTGFDFLFNSSKWWQFDQPWCLEQHKTYAKIAPSISFAESHDTPRLAAEAPGTIAAHKMRYLFAALFSEGLLMPQGYEFGAVSRIDVVNGSMADIDEPQWDLSDWIGHVNRLKREFPVMACEGTWRLVNTYGDPFVVLRKRSGGEGAEMVIIVNRQQESACTVDPGKLPRGALSGMKRWIRPCAGSFRPVKIPALLSLDPLEIVCLTK